MATRHVAVSFSSGQEVLNAYWGFLGDGGLVIRDDQGLAEGESVALDIHIASLDADYALHGHVVRTKQAAPTGPTSATVETAVIAFEPGEPHDMLLSAAIAEADDVPPRLSRRYEVDELVQLRADGRATTARIVNVSETGCCLRLGTEGHKDLPARCDKISIEGQHFKAHGRVVWSNRSERGVHFDESPGLRGRINDWIGPKKPS